MASENAAPRNQPIDTLVVRVILSIAALFAAVWAVDQHFITRTEFNTEMRGIHDQLKAVSHRLGIKQEPSTSPQQEGPEQ